MKKIINLIIAAFLILATPAVAANIALEDLAPATSMATGDLIPFTSDPGGTPASKNITRENFALSMQALLQGLPIATAAGTADAITADYTPDITLANMKVVAFVASAANATTTPTFAPDGLTARTIVKNGGSALAAGDIPGALAVCIVQYNLANTRWELLNPAAGSVSVPVKATGAELDTGTDDAKFATAKALKDSHNVPSVAPSTSGKVMTSDGTDWTSAALPAASTSASGIVELAIAIEVNTGTSDTLAITPDALAGSNFGKRVVEIVVFDYGTDVATGDGKAYFIVPDELNGMNLVRVASTVITAGTTNSTTVAIYSITDSAEMLSTLMAIETGETSTRTSATPGTIDTSHDDVVTGDVLRIDVDAVSSTAPKGLIVEMVFQLP